MTESRRPWRVIAAAVVVLLVGSVVVGVAVIRSGGTTPTTAMPAPSFVDEAASAGLQHTYLGGFDHFSTGGGVAAFDCSDDGKPELYLAGGSSPAALWRNDSPVGGALRFTPLPDSATDLTDVIGAYPLDIDGDGIVDLAVLRAGESDLLRGLGQCRFAAANETWSFAPGPGMTSAFSAAWEGDARLPTLAVGNYRLLDATGQKVNECGDNALLRPDAAGTAYATPIPLTPGYCALSMLFSDWDGSGRRDLRISNDRHYYDPVDGQEQLWRIAPGEAPRLYTDADGWVHLQLEGMGIASYDVTGDGLPDVYLTNEGPSTLQTLTSGPSTPTYRDIGNREGIEGTRPSTGGDPLPSTAWHPEFEDVNNDGFIDLFVSKGNVDARLDTASRDPSNLFLGQPAGGFVEGAADADIIDFARGRGAALTDLNLDGLLDLVEVNYKDPVRLWRNVGSGSSTTPTPMGHWLALRLSQSGPNRDGIGALIDVTVGETTMRRELTVGGGHAGGQLGWTHVGLGPSSSAQVRITWPDGQEGPWQDVSADQFFTIERDPAAVQPWTPS